MMSHRVQEDNNPLLLINKKDHFLDQVPIKILQAGSYLIRARSPAYKAARHQILINNVTDSAVAAVGQPEYCGGGESVGNRAFAAGRVTITGAKAFDIRHRVGNAETTYGLGVEANYDLQPNIYTIVEIFKEA